MRYKLLGTTGLRVSELSLGTMTFGEDWGWGAPKSACRKMFRTYVDAGGNFIDTADAYTGGTSEQIVGELIEGDRDRFVLATKYTLNTRPGDPNAGGSHRKNLFASVEESLERLGTDHIDLLWVHAWDPLTPIKGLVRALDDLVAQGTVHHVGFSDAPAWVVAYATALAEASGQAPFCAIQTQYSLVERTPERELFPMAEHLGLGVTTWSPLGQGLLTDKYLGGNGEDRGRLDTIGWDFEEDELAVARRVGELAEELGVSSPQIALAWIRHQDPSFVPIIGARTPTQLEENLASLDVTLSTDQLSRLDEATQVDLGFPLGFLAEPEASGMMYGGTRDQIEAPVSRWVPHG